MKDSPSLASENSSGTLEITIIPQTDNAASPDRIKLHTDSSSDLSDATDTIQSHMNSPNSSSAIVTEPMTPDSGGEDSRKRKRKGPAFIVHSTSKDSFNQFFTNFSKSPSGQAAIEAYKRRRLSSNSPKKGKTTDEKTKEEICNRQPPSPG